MVENLRVMLSGLVLIGLKGEAVVRGASVVMLMLSMPMVPLDIEEVAFAVAFVVASVVTPGEVTDPEVVTEGVVGGVKTDCVVDEVVPCNVVPGVVTVLC